MGSSLIFILLGIIAFIIISIAFSVVSWYKKPTVGKAMIRSGRGGIHVAFEEGIFIIPLLHQMEIVDLTYKEFEFNERLKTKDGAKIWVKGKFFVRINKESVSIIGAAQTLGIEKINSTKALENIFLPRFLDILLTVSRNQNVSEIEQNPDTFKVSILQDYGVDLSGFFVLDDLIFEKLEAVN